jgi:hypothetical protein
VYANTLPKEGVLVMGNEANGISKEIEVLVTKKNSHTKIWSSSGYRKSKCCYGNCNPFK